MNHIFYQTKTKFTNTGDALINHALIEVLREYGTIHANCSGSVPREFLKALGIKPEEREVTESEFAFIRSVILHAIKSRKNRDSVYVFSGPGDMYGGGLRLVVRNLVSGFVFPVFRILGVKIVRIGRSVGPISKMMALSERIRCAFLSHYYVRDTGSLQRCHAMGMKKVKLCPDMSWLYDGAHPKRINTTNCVMVNLRNAIFDDVEDDFIEATLNKCEDVLRELNKQMSGKMKVRIAFQVQGDAEFNRSIYERLRSEYDVDFVNHQMGLDELRKYYGEVDYHISNRMHSLLAGYKYGSLPIGLIDIKKHMKIANTFWDCNISELLIDIHDNLDEKKIEKICRYRAELMEDLFVCEEKQRNVLMSELDRIFESWHQIDS